MIDDLGYDQLEILLGLAGQKEVAIPEWLVRGYLPKLGQHHADCCLAVFPSKVSVGSQS